MRGRGSGGGRRERESEREREGEEGEREREGKMEREGEGKSERERDWKREREGGGEREKNKIAKYTEMLYLKIFIANDSISGQSKNIENNHNGTVWYRHWVENTSFIKFILSFGISNLHID